MRVTVMPHSLLILSVLISDVIFTVIFPHQVEFAQILSVQFNELFQLCSAV